MTSYLAGWIETLTPQNWKQNVVKYAIQSTIGSFLEEVDWDGLDLHFVNGTLTLTDIKLNTKAFNRYLAPNGLKSTFGVVGKLLVVIPWTGFLSEACSMEIDDIQLHIVKCDPEIIEEEEQDVRDEMSSSFSFEDSLRQTSNEEIQGLEKEPNHMGTNTLAHIINSILAKVTLSLNRTKVKILLDNDWVQLEMERLSIIDHIAKKESIPMQIRNLEQFLDRMIKYMVIENVQIFKFQQKLTQLMRLSRSTSRIILRSENEDENGNQMSVYNVIEKIVVLANSHELDFLLKVAQKNTNSKLTPNPDKRKLAVTTEIEKIIFILFEADKSEHLDRKFQDFCCDINIPPISLAKRPHIALFGQSGIIKYTKDPSNINEPRRVNLDISKINVAERIADSYVQYIRLQDADEITLPMISSTFSLLQRDSGASFGSILVEIPKIELNIDENAKNFKKYFNGFTKQNDKKSPVKNPVTLKIANLLLTGKAGNVLPVLELDEFVLKVAAPTASKVQNRLNDPQLSISAKSVGFRFKTDANDIVSFKDFSLHYAGILPLKIHGINEDFIRKQHENYKKAEDKKEWSDFEDNSSCSSPKNTFESPLFSSEFMSCRLFLSCQIQDMGISVTTANWIYVAQFVSYIQSLNPLEPVLSTQPPISLLIHVANATALIKTLNVKIEDLDLTTALNAIGTKNMLFVSASCHSFGASTDVQITNPIFNSEAMLKAVFSQVDDIASLSRTAIFTFVLRNSMIHLPLPSLDFTDLKIDSNLDNPFKTEIKISVVVDDALFSHAHDTETLVLFITKGGVDTSFQKESMVRKIDVDVSHGSVFLSPNTLPRTFIDGYDDNIYSSFQNQVKKLGFARIANMQKIVISVSKSTGLPLFDCLIQLDQLCFELCSDSLQTVKEYVNNYPKSQQSKTKVQSSKHNIEVFESVDDSAFAPSPKIETGDEWHMNFEDLPIESSIKAYPGSESFVLDNGYLDSKRNDPTNEQKLIPNIRLQLKNSNISFNLFGGSDWEGTRENEYSLQIHLIWINLLWTIFPDGPISKKLTLNIRDVEAIDHVRTSQWRKFFAYQTPESDQLPRETNSDMFKIVWQTIPELDDEETTLLIKCLPIRMYVDQDTLLFLVSFLTPPDEPIDVVYEMEDSVHMPEENDEDDVFFRNCEISPIHIKVDYKAKHVDYSKLRRGKFKEILNFISLDGAELHLVPVKLVGVKGWKGLTRKIADIWLPHIQNTQIPNVAGGVSGIKSLVRVGSGVKELVTKPIEVYQQDKNIYKGITQGTGAFIKATTVETVKLTNRIAIGAQNILEKAENMLTDEERKRKSNYSDQPSDIMQGLQMGYAKITMGIKDAASNMAQSQEDPRMVNVPLAMLQPVIGLTSAISTTLIGLSNSLDKTQKKRNDDKYK